MQTKDKVLICACGLVVILASPFLYVAVISILPNVGVIGAGLTGFILLCIGCASLLVVSFTFSRIGLWDAKRRHAANTVNLVSADGLVILLQSDGSIRHLSAELEASRAIASPQQNNTIESKYPATQETIMELWEQGLSLDTIASSCKMPTEDVKKVLRRKF